VTEPRIHRRSHPGRAYHWLAERAVQGLPIRPGWAPVYLDYPRCKLRDDGGFLGWAPFPPATKGGISPSSLCCQSGLEHIPIILHPASFPTPLILKRHLNVYLNLHELCRNCVENLNCNTTSTDSFFINTFTFKQRSLYSLQISKPSSASTIHSPTDF
jgi:hypothetical protein